MTSPTPPSPPPVQQNAEPASFPSSISTPTPTQQQLALWEAEQGRVAALVTHTDAFAFPDDVALIGGVDLSFFPPPIPSSSSSSTPTRALACLVVLTYPALHVVYEAFYPTHLLLPYLPSFLAFREAPPLLHLLAELRTTHPSFFPQLLLVDGNGVLHPRGCGLASHLGVVGGIPTIGIAKTFMHVDGLETKGVKRRMEEKRGGKRKEEEEEISSSVDRDREAEEEDEEGRSTAGGGRTNPIFVSVGTGVSLKTALNVVRACCKQYRVPEPVRQADILSRAKIREILEKERKKGEE